MALTLEDVNSLKCGYRNPVWVGEFPYAVAKALGLNNHNIYLSKQSLEHILYSHRDISMFNVLMLPLAIKRGLLIQELRRPGVVLVSYLDSSDGKRFVAALKTTASGAETWVSTFHRAHRRQTLSMMKRGKVLKTHD